MASDPSLKGQLLSKVKSGFSPFRRGSMTTQGDGSSKQTLTFRAPFRSSTTNLLPGNTESKADHGTGHTPSAGDPSLPKQPRTINVVLFGETGVGKSSVINLIARREVAKVSSDVNGCTMQSTRHNISFDGVDYSIFDTIGLEEPQMGVNGYLKAIEKAYELIVKLSAAGGIHLLLFCMRGGRITATTQSNYRLFCECLCNAKVPIALVFTNLEREVEMEDWWTRNKNHIEHFGIKSNGHVCITAVQDDTPGEDLKYAESQRRIRDLLKTCALKSEAFLPETYSWFARLGKGMRSFIEKHRNPKRRNVMWVLTHRCKLDSETARKIADMMEKGDAETKGGTPEEQTKNKEVDSRSGSAGEKGENGGMKGKVDAEPGSTNGQLGATQELATDHPLASQHDLEAGPRTEWRDMGGVAAESAGESRPSENVENVAEIGLVPIRPQGKENIDVADAANDRLLRNAQHIVEAGPRPVTSEKKENIDVTDAENDCPSRNSQHIVEAGLLPVTSEKDEIGASDGRTADGSNPQHIVEAGVRSGGNPTKGHPQPEGNLQSVVETEARTERKDKGGVTDKKTVKGSLSGSLQSIVKAPVTPEREAEVTSEKGTNDYSSGNTQNIPKAEVPPVRPERNDKLEIVRGRPLGSPWTTADTPPGLEGRDKTGFASQWAEGSTSANSVELEDCTTGSDKDGMTSRATINEHTSVTPQNVVDTESRPVREVKDKRGHENKRSPALAAAAAQNDVDAQHRTTQTGGKDRRQSRTAGNSVDVGSQPRRSRQGDMQPGHPQAPISATSYGPSRQYTMPGSLPD